MGQYERELISERTKAGLAAAKARGTKPGNPNLNLVRNTDTTAAINARSVKAAERAAQLREVITELEADAGYEITLQQVADALKTAGMPLLGVKSSLEFRCIGLRRR